MRHNRKINHLGRTASHRQALLSNLACSLLKHKRIFTTLPKARELRKYVEPLITKSKEDTTHSRRVVFSALQDKYAVTELFQEISHKIAERPGGYTRIIKTGFRLGDNAAMCLIELVDYNENLLKEKKQEKAPKTRRSRRRKTKEGEESSENVVAASETTASENELVSEEKIQGQEEAKQEPEKEEKPEKEIMPAASEDKAKDTKEESESPKAED